MGVIVVALSWSVHLVGQGKTSVSCSYEATREPNKRVSFEKRYHDGGTYRLYGPKIVKAEGDLLLNASFDWYYFCKARDTMVPLPVGYMPVIDGEDN